MLGQYSKYPRQGNAQPFGPVSQLVFDLVESLFKQKEVQHLLGSLRIGWPEICIRHDLAIGGQEGRGRAIAPFPERGAKLALLVGRYFQRALQCGGGRIVDRTDQACDVARRGRLAPPLIQRPARLALEIDDEDIVLDDQYLSEMEV